MMRPLFPLLLLGLLRPFTAGCPLALTQHCEPTDGYTFQYGELNALHEEMKPLGLTILGFPCNQFGNQEPGQNHEILPGLMHVRPGNGFVPNFLLFEKGDVNGKDEQEVFTFLKKSCPPVGELLGDPSRLFWGPMKLSDIKWNFEKFLVGPNGKPVMRWHPSISIPQVRADIRKYLLLQLYTHSRG
ncbi:Glutathione peroxidase 3 [Dissostichus eleginoides]|nr:Glutathione peroxidase 3 [Dissostichus eleginoides]